MWRSVRLHSDTKTEKSRRTLALPQSAVTALREHRKRQAEARLAAGPLWQETGLVFTSSLGTPLDASHVRRDFRGLRKKAATRASNCQTPACRANSAALTGSDNVDAWSRSDRAPLKKPSLGSDEKTLS